MINSEAEKFLEMLFKKRCQRPPLSVIVIFNNMRREAPRTLYTLSREYQQLGRDTPYEVIAIDNGSTQRLETEMVTSLDPDFRYSYVATDAQSPCETINRFIADARYENVAVIIDGARMLSPGIIKLMQTAFDAFAHPFVYTLGMHLGKKPQNYLAEEGYDARTEDELLEMGGWKSDGYRLFSISSVALSSKRGFFSKIAESNCFAMRKKELLQIGGYNSHFQSAGGGLCNLELFNRVHEAAWIQPVMLLGEATFHQFHGGVATNVPVSQHPWRTMQKEYHDIVGEPWRNKSRSPVYLGSFRQECATLYNTAAIDAFR